MAFVTSQRQGNLAEVKCILQQCSATFSYSRHTKTMSKFLRHTSAKKRRKFTHQIAVTTVQWDQQFNGMLGVVVTSSIAACWALYLKWQLEVPDQFLSSMIVCHFWSTPTSKNFVHTNMWCRTGEEFRELFPKFAYILFQQLSKIHRE